MVPARLQCVQYSFENDSNGIDGEVDVHGFDENGDGENNDTAALECDITEGEVNETIRTLKYGKAAGPDQIIGDFFNILLHMLSPFLSDTLTSFLFLFLSGLYSDS